MDKTNAINNPLGGSAILSESDFLSLSNVVIYNAIKIYQKEFKSNHIPATFIKFYIRELSGYDHLFDAKLRAYFDRANNRSNRISVMMNSFNMSFPLYVTKFGSDDYVEFIEVASDDDIPEDILYFAGDDKMLASAFNSIKLIIKHYAESDELRSVEYIFKDYLFSHYKADLPLSEDAEQNTSNELVEEVNEIDKIVKNKQFGDEEALKKFSDVSPKARQSNAALLTGRVIEVPKQKGKVISILFPELPLPCDYPTLIEHSRVNTRYKVQKFMRASEELSLINNFAFNQIKYSLDFINKRKVIAYDLKRSNRFNFKF